MEMIYEKIKALIKIQLSELKHDIESLVKELKCTDDKLLHSQADLLDEYSNYFKSIKSFDRQENIFKVIMMVGSLESEINTFYLSLKTVQLRFNIAKLNPLAQKILNGIKVLSSRLWQLLSSLLKLESWSITGNANINVLGLTGGITLQLCFK